MCGGCSNESLLPKYLAICSDPYSSGKFSYGFMDIRTSAAFV